jgi:hypothetical protein
VPDIFYNNCQVLIYKYRDIDLRNMYNISFFVRLYRISFKGLSHTTFTMDNYKTTFVILGVAAALALVMTASVVPAALADVKGSTDTSCTNSGGNQPGGQQPSCQGGGLTQETCSATTGNGNCPRGQNR